MYYYNEIKEMNEITGIFKLHNVLLQFLLMLFLNSLKQHLNYIMYYYNQANVFFQMNVNEI